MSRVPVTRTGRHGGVAGVVIGPQEMQNRRVDTILKQACTNGCLRLTNRNLSELPREVFFLHDMEYENKQWWDQQDITVFDVSHNQLKEIAVPTGASAPMSSSSTEGPRGSLAPRGTTLSSATTRGPIVGCPPHLDPALAPLLPFHTLRLIVASYNQLVMFPDALLRVCGANLTKLDLGHNALSPNSSIMFCSPVDLSHPPSSWMTFPSLLELDLSHNQLVLLADLAIRCPMIEKLNASHNKISHWVETSPAVMSSYPPAPGSMPPRTASLNALRHVDLSHNALQSLGAFRSSKGDDGGLLVSQPLTQRMPNLMHLDVCYNALTTEGLGGPSPSSAIAFAAVFPSSLVTLNMKQNRLTCIPCPLGNLSSLRELYLGNNSVSNAPPDVFSGLTSLEMLDVSNNKLDDVEFLLPLKTTLTRLDVQNNNLSTLPPEMGLFSRLAAVVLDGNPLRAIRRDVVAKGTGELLAFLRSRLKPGAAAAELNGKPKMSVRDLDTQVLVSAERDQKLVASGVHGAYAGGMKADDRPFATDYNHQRTADAAKQLNESCVRLGEHQGTTWDLSRGSSGSGGGAQQQRLRPVVPPSARRGGNDSLLTLSNGVAAQGPTPLLPAVVDRTLNASELHATTEDRFREQVQSIRFNGQTQVACIGVTFLATFTKLRELDCSSCSSLERIDESTTGDERSLLESLKVLTFSRCAFTSATLDATLQCLTRRQASISRLDLSFNALLQSASPITQLSATLQYLRLDGNTSLGGDKASLQLWAAVGRLSQLLELSLIGCSITEMPSDEMQWEGKDRHVGFCESSWPSLQSLDISNNALTTIPFTIGRMKQHLRTFNVDGNAIRWLRMDVLRKGTHAVLQYLEDRIPQQR